MSELGFFGLKDDKIIKRLNTIYFILVNKNEG